MTESEWREAIKFWIVPTPVGVIMASGMTAQGRFSPSSSLMGLWVFLLSSTLSGHVPVPAAAY